MVRPATSLVVLGFALAAGSGCAYGELRQVLRAQVASELDCPEVRIEYKDLRYYEQDLTKERYKVTGCGVERTYTCPQDPGLVSYDEPVCTFVEGDPDRPEIATVETEAASDEPIDEPIEEPAPKAKAKPKAKKPKPTGFPKAVEPEPEPADAVEAEPENDDAPATDDAEDSKPVDPTE